MDKSNEIELLQAQLIQERALVQDLEAGKSKMILDAIEVGGQFSDLREAVRVLKEVLQFVMLKAPGYDWNTDPLSITLMVGNAFTKSNHVLAGEPDEENDSLQDQLTQRTAELEALRKWRDYVTVALQRPGGAFFEDVPKHIIDLVAELEATHQQISAAQETILRTYTASAALDLVGVKAELERVRGELAETKEEVKCLDEQVLAMNEWGLTVEKLLLALPKVEGEIRVGKTVDNCWFIDNQDAGGLRGRYKDDGPKYAALLQHRQRMEG